MKKQIVTVKTLVAATALLASGISLASAQTGSPELYASGVSGDLVIVRTPGGSAAYIGSTVPVIRHHAIVQRKQR